MELKIALAVLSIVSALITGILIPYIKTKIDQQKRSELMDIVDIAVKGAEQIYQVKKPNSKNGEEKKQYVLDILENYNIKLTDEELNTIIEATVHELNLWQKEVRGK